MLESHALDLHGPPQLRPPPPAFRWPSGYRRDPNIAAAVLPYYQGRAAVVIMGGMRAPQLLAARTIEAGRLVARDHVAADGYGREPDLHRTFTDDDLRALVTQVLAMFAEHSASAVFVEGARGGPGVTHTWSAQIGAQIQRAIGDACNGNVPVRVIDPAWRASASGADLESMVRRRVQGWPTSPEQGDAPATRIAGAVLVHLVDTLLPRASAPSTTTTPETPPPTTADAAAPVVLPVAPRAVAASVVLTSDPADAPPGRRTMTIDPGGRWVGIVIAAGDAAPLAALHVETKEAGKVVPLARPRKKTRRDGTAQIVTERRALPWALVLSLAGDVVELARRFGVTHAAVERVENASGKEGAARGAGTATGLVRSAEIGAVISAELARAGVAVERPQVATVRARVVGRSNAKGDARKGLVGVAVARAFVNWPEASDAHQRDAGALAVWSVMPPPAPPARRAPGASPRCPAQRAPGDARKDPRDRTGRARPALRAQQEAERQHRAAGGCIGCPARHKIDCPMYEKKTYTRRQPTAPAPST